MVLQLRIANRMYFPIIKDFRVFINMSRLKQYEREGSITMKLVIVNGGPRLRGWNTAAMLEAAANGARAEGAEVETIYAGLQRLPELFCLPARRRRGALCRARCVTTGPRPHSGGGCTARRVSYLLWRRNGRNARFL